MKASEICEKAASLVGGDRASQHGDMSETHENIARLWSAYLNSLDTTFLLGKDVAMMMVLLKVARTMNGEENLDDYVDIAGYAGCAGQIATENT